MRKIIDLKIVQPHFDDVASGRKKAELRKDDRDFAVGDMLILREWTGTEYTGRSVGAIVTHILKNCGFGLAEGYVILSIKLCGGKNVKSDNKFALHSVARCDSALFAVVGNIAYL